MLTNMIFNIFELLHTSDEYNIDHELYCLQKIYEITRNEDEMTKGQ
jgi:hypothetical protein